MQLCFLHVNDSHGVGVTPDGRGDCRLARVATVVRQARAEKGPDAVFVTVGGDIGVHPHDEDYRHHRTGEANGHAHLKSVLVHHQVIVPVTDGRLDLGPWQQIYYAEFDGRRRKRVILKMIGE